MEGTSSSYTPPLPFESKPPCGHTLPSPCASVPSCRGYVGAGHRIGHPRQGQCSGGPTHSILISLCVIKAAWYVGFAEELGCTVWG